MLSSRYMYTCTLYMYCTCIYVVGLLKIIAVNISTVIAVQWESLAYIADIDIDMMLQSEGGVHRWGCITSTYTYNVYIIHVQYMVHAWYRHEIMLTLTRKAETVSGSVMWEQWGWWSVMELRGNRMLHVGHWAGLQGMRPLSDEHLNGRGYIQHGTQQGTILRLFERQSNTTQHNTTQQNTTQHNTTQHNTTQYNSTQHNT